MKSHFAFPPFRALPSLPVRGAWIEIFYKRSPFCTVWVSLPVRGAWIEMSAGRLPQKQLRRSPCGERGLKFYIVQCDCCCFGRSPCGERGLKCACSARKQAIGYRRSPCGERGLKLRCRYRPALPPRRSPCGERGLKLVIFRSASAYGSRSPCGERGLKSRGTGFVPPETRSLPVRGAWIEMQRK